VSLAPYIFTPGDKFVITGGSNVILGAYDIVAKDSDEVLSLASDINGASGDENESITGYILKAPIAATTVNATGNQVTATFNLTNATPGYRNIIVQVGTHEPIVWREGFNVIYPGPDLVNPSFELPFSFQDCANRVETFTPASDWNVCVWNGY